MNDPNQITRTVGEVLSLLTLSDDLRNELKQYPEDWLVFLHDDNRLAVAPPQQKALAPWDIKEPHYVGPGDGCMGDPTPGYWRVFAHRGDSLPLMGTGPTAEAAKKQVVERILAGAHKPLISTTGIAV